MSNVIHLPKRPSRKAVSLEAVMASICRSADVAAVDQLKGELVDWLDAHGMNSPTALLLLVTVLLGECAVAADTAREDDEMGEGCGSPDCPECTLRDADLTAQNIYGAVALLMSRLMAPGASAH